MEMEVTQMKNNFTESVIGEYTKNLFITVKEYQTDPIATIESIDDAPGVYLVVSSFENPRGKFLGEGTGGWFKGKNPNVPIEVLEEKWTNCAEILYIGRAGGISINGRESKATLKKRIRALLLFGNQKPVGHWGGRYLWQHPDSDNFRIYWSSKDINGKNPVELEKELIGIFKENYNGKRPFANLRL